MARVGTSTAQVKKICTYLPRVKAYLEKKPCATYKEIAESLSITTSSVKICFETGKLNYKGNLRAPKVGSAALARRAKTASLILRQMGPSGGNKVLVMDRVSFVSTNVHNNHSYSLSTWWPKYKPAPTKAYWDKLVANMDPPPDYYLVWQAMTSDGLVSPIVIKINKFDTREYVEECLRKVLVPWLKENYKLEDVLLWPDLCPRHNSSHVRKLLDANKISYVKKSDNAPKLTRARPIVFCSNKCKEEYTTHIYHKRQPKDVEEFRKIYTKINEGVMEKHAKGLCAEIPENLEAIQKCHI